MTIEKVSQQHSEVRASNFDRVTRISHSQLVISSFFFPSSSWETWLDNNILRLELVILVEY